MSMPITVLCSLVSYDPNTGALTWKKTGKPAFSTPSGHGYLSGKAPKAHGGQTVYAHRAAFAITYGYWPDQIDHINGKTSDNRDANLREVSCGENQKNTKLYSTNRSGFPGVVWDEENGMWRAVICVSKRQVHLGRFVLKSDAVAARKTAEDKYGFHENHGRST